MMQRILTGLTVAVALTTVPGCSLLRPNPAAESPSPAREDRQDAEQERDEPDFEPYDEVITDEAVTRTGLFTTHRVDDDLFFEIPRDALNREMLLVARPVESTMQDQGSFYGGSSRMIVQWERRDDRILVRRKRYDAVADSTSNIWRRVSGYRNGPIIASFEIETFGPDSAAVVDVTGLYMSSIDEMGSIGGLQRDRSWFVHVAAFPRNVEVEAVQTGRGSSGEGSPATQTQRMHWSMLQLPETPMMPRLRDRRVGFNSSGHTDYSRPEHRAEERRFIHRFRLEPSDTAAYRRGELVEPVEPIVYWVDPATPDWLQPWVVEGVNKWNVAFEEAGFRNAIRGEVAPADDPDWSLVDARHSVIYWNPSSVANATGGQTVDPRSGEILKGEVNMYHNVQNLLRNWYFTQVSPLDARARNLPLPDSLMGRLVEYVVTHEIGHSIGFPHNMKASAMYPVDSLRSEGFLRRMGGHVATLMDYSRFNYVAQPEDDIPPELLIPNVGPYDRFAVRWGYRPILDARTPDEERPTLDRWARAQDTVPYFRFTTYDASSDPADLTEAVGDQNAVRASQLGLRNLDRIMASLIDVAERPGEDYELLDELYGNVVSQWSRYMSHVASVVGGAETQEKYGTGERFEPVTRERQAEAVQFLTETAFQTPMLFIDPAILRRIEDEGVVGRIRSAQARVLNTLISPSRFRRMGEYEALAEDPSEAYTIADLMNDVRAGVWGELDDPRVQIDIYRRNLQRSYLDAADARLNPEDGGGAELMDTRPVLRGELADLQESVDRAIDRASDTMTRLHLRDVSVEIDRILDPRG